MCVAAFPVKAVILGTGGVVLILFIIAVVLGGYFLYPKFATIGAKKYVCRIITSLALSVYRFSVYMQII